MLPPGPFEEDAESTMQQQQQQQGQQQRARWGILDASAWNRKFNVPWGLVTTLAGMGVCGLSFKAIDLFLHPKLYLLFGIDRQTASTNQRASMLLMMAVLQTTVAIGITWSITRTHRFPPASDPRKYLPLLASSTFDSAKTTDNQGCNELFNFSPLKPFTKPNGWLFWGLLGVVAAPFVNVLFLPILLLVEYFDEDDARPSPYTIMMDMFTAGNITTLLIMLGAHAVLDTLLGEVVFRGFLLPSLTRHMPTWCAVLASAAYNGALFLPSVPGFLSYTYHGVLLGFIYVRSRNLLTPLIVRGAWGIMGLTFMFRSARRLADAGISISYGASNGMDVQQH